MNKPILVKWSDKQSDIGFSTINELDDWLDKYSQNYLSDSPTIVTIYTHDYEIGVGFGLQESFVHIEHKSGESPYFITIGERDLEGEIAFYLHSNHHTEISKRHLIPLSLARSVVREFCLYGKRSTNVQWEEV